MNSSELLELSREAPALSWRTIEYRSISLNKAVRQPWVSQQIIPNRPLSSGETGPGRVMREVELAIVDAL